MENNYCVYKHTCPDGTFYYGMTGVRPSKRWRNGKGYSTQPFYHKILEFDWSCIDSEILEGGMSESEAKEKEAALIEKAFFTQKDKLLNRYPTIEGKEITEPRHDWVSEYPWSEEDILYHLWATYEWKKNYRRVTGYYPEYFDFYDRYLSVDYEVISERGDIVGWSSGAHVPEIIRDTQGVIDWLDYGNFESNDLPSEYMGGR